jgi:putative Ig domain-containing protein
MRSARSSGLLIVIVAGVVGVVVLLGAAALVSPNRTPATTARAVAAAAHSDRLKVRPADGVTDEADGEGAAVRENPTGDEEEREATVPHAGALTASCGVERWSVKTGTDADAGKISLASTTSTSISFLDGLAQPASLPANNRIAPTETTVFQLQATLVEYKLETDSDFHLVLSDGTHTMIAEIPDPACVGAGSPLLSGITKARGEFTAKFTPTSSFKTANLPVTITGVGFFDFLHGQTGVAPNGIELHAVLDVQFGATTSAVSVTNPGAQTGTVGRSTSLQIAATDSAGAALTYSATGLPAGLSISSTTGLISGTPTTAGTNNVTVTARDSSSRTGSAQFTWAIAAAGGGGTCAASQLLGNPGFETGTAAPWAATTGVISNRATQPPRTGTWDAWLDGYGTTHTDTLSQAVTLPTGCTTYSLAFWLHIDTAETSTTTAFDKLQVQVLNSAGSVLTTLGTFTNLNAVTGYAQHTFSLASFAGQTVTVKFTGAEDSIDQTSFVVDDTALNVS